MVREDFIVLYLNPKEYFHGETRALWLHREAVVSVVEDGTGAYVTARGGSWHVRESVDEVMKLLLDELSVQGGEHEADKG